MASKSVHPVAWKTLPKWPCGRTQRRASRQIASAPKQRGGYVVGPNSKSSSSSPTSCKWLVECCKLPLVQPAECVLLTQGRPRAWPAQQPKRALSRHGICVANCMVTVEDPVTFGPSLPVRLVEIFGCVLSLRHHPKWRGRFANDRIDSACWLRESRENKGLSEGWSQL